MPAVSVQFAHLKGVFPLLDDLQVGFILINPSGHIAHASYWVRRALPRKALKGTGLQLLGESLHAELCRPVLDGRSSGGRWREAELEGREEGSPLQVAIRSAEVDFGEGERGVLLALNDVSSEVGLHRQNKALLEKQKQINANLRKEIAKQLREHEDDIAQLNEILQIAPAIFASFMAEAGTAIHGVESLIEHNGDAVRLEDCLRDMHTLKGNARSLGLNFIGGRAHHVEELLLAIRSETREKRRSTLLVDLKDLLDDLERARNRASFVRSRLGAAELEPQVDMGHHRKLQAAEDALQEALAAIPATTPGIESLKKARQALEMATHVELQQLFELVKASVAKVSQGSALDCPQVNTSGGTIRVGPRIYGALSAALPHLSRNAVSHGIESAEERLEAGKPALGLIELEAIVEDERLHLRLRDDGRGVDRAAVEKIAKERGYPSPSTPEELANLLLQPGVSTSESVDQDKGRGMGTVAARDAIDEVGGEIRVESASAVGTTFEILVPLSTRKL